MEGQGVVAAMANHNDGRGSLEYVVKHEPTAAHFKHLMGPDGKWRVRDDVWVSYNERKGPLTVGFGAKEGLIGPELGFGWVMGEALTEPVLPVKCPWGGKGLAVDFRPPNSGKVPFFQRRILLPHRRGHGP